MLFDLLASHPLVISDFLITLLPVRRTCQYPLFFGTDISRARVEAVPKRICSQNYQLDSEQHKRSHRTGQTPVTALKQPRIKAE